MNFEFSNKVKELQKQNLGLMKGEGIRLFS